MIGIIDSFFERQQKNWSAVYIDEKVLERNQKGESLKNTR